jgi:prepilin-type N-terminal cleavage/methylation domain-containing protein
MNAGRRGKTLIELVVVVAITSVVLTMTTATLVTLFRVERQIRGDVEQTRSLDRLDARVRTDAHAAIAAKIENGCELTLADDRTVRYTFADSQVWREVRRGGMVQHRDAFELPERAQAAFTLADDGGRQLIVLSIRPAELPERAYATAVRAATILAVVNLHRAPSTAEDRP